MKPATIEMCDFVKTVGRASYKEYVSACSFPALLELPPEAAMVGCRIEFDDTPGQTLETVRERLRSLLPIIGKLKVHVLVPDARGKVNVGAGKVDLRLPGTSLRHAELFAIKGAWRVRDKESAEGTRVESNRIPVGIPIPLVGGQYVTFGRFRALFLESRHLHGLARLALRPRTERATWPAEGLLLKDVLDAVARSVLPGPESGPYLLQVPVKGTRQQSTGAGLTQACSEESLLDLQRADALEDVRLFSLAVGPSGSTTIGRGTDCEVVVGEGSASRRHAALAPAGDHWELVDLESGNGTFLQGKRLPAGIRVPVKAQQTLQFGGFRCVFMEVDELCDMLRFLQRRVANLDPLASVA